MPIVSINSRRKSYRASSTLRRSRRKKSNTGTPLVVSIFLLVAMMIGGAIYMVATSEKTDVAQNLCREDGIIPSHTVYLIDASDKISSNDIEYTINLLKSEQNGLLQYSKLTVLQLKARVDAAPARDVVELFSLCSPGQPHEFSQFSSSTKKKRALWDKGFGKPLEFAMKRISKLEQADNTPLLEAISTVTARFDFREQIEKKKLVIISDLLHFTKEYSLYQPNPKFSQISNSAYFGAIPASLEDVEVRVLHIKRRSTALFQGKAHKRFWRDYFKHQNAMSLDYVRR